MEHVRVRIDQKIAAVDWEFRCLRVVDSSTTQVGPSNGHEYNQWIYELKQRPTMVLKELGTIPNQTGDGLE